MSEPCPNLESLALASPEDGPAHLGALMCGVRNAKKRTNRRASRPYVFQPMRSRLGYIDGWCIPEFPFCIKMMKRPRISLML